MAIAVGCESRSAPILPFISTAATALDMESLRVLLGEEKISYLGYSNGTLLGALYADAYPQRIRAFVLDGVVDPKQTGSDLIVGQALGFEQVFNDFAAACAADTHCTFHGGGDVLAAYDALAASIDANPLLVDTGSGGVRTLGPGEFNFAVTFALYDDSYWPFLASGLRDAEAGDGSTLLMLSDAEVGRNADGTYDPFYEDYLAISSIDDVYPTTIEGYDALAEQVRPMAPRLGPSLVYNSILPMFWPVPPARIPGPVTAAGSAPILVIGNLADPATPYASAQALAGELQSSVLLTWNGDGHTAFGGKSQCIDDAVVAYLEAGTLPAAGTICDSMSRRVDRPVDWRMDARPTGCARLPIGRGHRLICR
jgi:pimeloyl-ACP methyl ester carboxylesterase